MMRVLKQAELNHWLNQMTKDHALVAPTDVQGKVLYHRVQDTTEIAWGFQRTDMSPKEWLFPATEPILAVEQGAETRITAPSDPPAVVLFGVRPCDARGLRAIDALFLDKPPADVTYAQHRSATTIIGLACPRMWESCFCTVVGGAPDSSEGLDLLLTEIPSKGAGSDYAVQATSDQGKQLLATMPGEEKDLALPVSERKAGLPVLPSATGWGAQFNEALWRQVSQRCLSCRACTFVCPTCRCFDVRDEVVAREAGNRVIHRLRAWDACTSSPYRRIAGGHNPRPTQRERLRNRFYCKFMYYPQDFGPLGCVGCGRCIDACPVGIDILEVIANVESLVNTRSS